MKNVRHSVLFVTGVSVDTLCIGQRLNLRSLNPRYRHEAAATDHPWLSSDTAIWSLGVQAVCAIWHRPSLALIRYGYLVFGRAGRLRYLALSLDSDAISFWSCDQSNVYF